MVGWMIVAGILLLLAVLLLSPAVLRVTYRDNAVLVNAKYLFFRLDFDPAAEHKTKPKKEKRKRKKKKEEEKDPKQTMAAVWDLVKSSRRGLNILRKHLVFSRLRVYICVGGEDAHQIALASSKLRLAVLAALDVLELLFVMEDPEVAILPNFTATANRYDLLVQVQMRPAFVIAAGFSILFRFLRLQLSEKGKRKQADPVKTT